MKIAIVPKRIIDALLPISNASKLLECIPNVEIIRAGKKTDRRIILTTDSEKTEIAIVKIPFLDFNSNNVFFYF
tara:strand:- start:332 stop:553 length:222 start_codon:yes stop_codon:yes gene_type:complete